MPPFKSIRFLAFPAKPLVSGNFLYSRGNTSNQNPVYTAVLDCAPRCIDNSSQFQWNTGLLGWKIVIFRCKYHIRHGKAIHATLKSSLDMIFHFQPGGMFMFQFLSSVVEYNTYVKFSKAKTKKNLHKPFLSDVNILFLFYWCLVVQGVC